MKKGPKRMTDEEIKELVAEIRGGKYMILDTEEKVRIGCGVLLMTSNLEEQIDTKNVGMVLGDLNSTIGGRYCNGIPMFAAFKFIHKDDWPIVADSYNASLDVKVVRP